MSFGAIAGAVAGGAMSLGSSALSSYLSYKQQKKIMQNRHQWEVDDLRKAGLNPILSAGGSGSPGSAPIVNLDSSGFEKGWHAGLAKDMTEAQVNSAKASADLEREKVNSERQLQQVYLNQGVKDFNAAQQLGLQNDRLRLTNKILQQQYNYMQKHPQARDFGNWFQLINPFNSASSMAAGASALMR